MVKMPRYFSVWLAFCIFPTLLWRAVWTYECLEKESLLRPLPRELATDCLMECTRRTYMKKLQSQDPHDVQFTDCTQGDLGEYCWSTNLKCKVGQSFKHAFVVLPEDITVEEPVEVNTTSPAATKLSVHIYPTIIAKSCGLLYDVTNYFSPVNTGTLFCIQTDKVPRCPPYLVIFWQRSSNQAHQKSYG